MRFYPKPAHSYTEADLDRAAIFRASGHGFEGFCSGVGAHTVSRPTFAARDRETGASDLPYLPS